MLLKIKQRTVKVRAVTKEWFPRKTKHLPCKCAVWHRHCSLLMRTINKMIDTEGLHLLAGRVSTMLIHDAKVVYLPNRLDNTNLEEIRMEILAAFKTCEVPAVILNFSHCRVIDARSISIAMFAWSLAHATHKPFSVEKVPEEGIVRFSTCGFLPEVTTAEAV